RQLELPRRLQADGAVLARQRDGLAVLEDRFPAELGQPSKQVANAARLLVRRRAVIDDAIDELLVLGADPPALGRLLAAGEKRQQIVAALDRRTLTRVRALRHGRRRLAPPATPRQQIGFMAEPVLLIA